MRACAVLVWFDEPPDLLHRTVSSWGQLCDSLIALDGRFRDFPDDRVNSPGRQRSAIHRGAADGGMGSYVGGANTPWRGHPEKRTAALRLAREMWNPDWLLCADADEELVPGDLPEILRETLLDVVEVETEIGAQRGAERIKKRVRQRRVFRSLPGLEVGPHHYRYHVLNRKVLWDAPGKPQDPAATSTGVLLHHREDRPAGRLSAARDYYRKRGREPGL